MTDITITLSRADLIVLAILADRRHMEVLDAAADSHTEWSKAVAGSEDARLAHQVYQDDLRYAAELKRLWAKLDAAVESHETKTAAA